MRWHLALLPLTLAFSLGCGNGTPSIPPPPSYDPDAMAAAAMKEYDKNGNGTIEGAELDAVPALKNSLTQIDKNGDKKISTEELKARFEAYKTLSAGLVSVSFSLSLGDQPLEDATVTFTPENCMLGKIKAATATTQGDGTITHYTLDGQSQPGLPCGLYKITVSKKDASGKELIPERYNSSTPLGGEFFDGSRGTSSDIHLKLSAK